MSKIDDTITMLEEHALKHPRIAVAYSDGKDSRVVLDLCQRVFTHVEAFFMYLVPDLECITAAMGDAEARHGVKIKQIPHWLPAQLLKGGVYCDPWWGHDSLPKWKLRDCYTLGQQACGANMVATGAKNADSAWRRRFMHATKDWEDVINPIADWSKFDVLGYLKARKIPEPISSGHSATGIDLSVPSLLWLHDTYPNDFARLREYFPYIQAVIERRSIYGTTA